MTLRIKSGGAWRDASPGATRIKWGGWNTANYVRIRWNGAWQDSGYRGYPNQPVQIQVADWDNNSFGWVKIVFQPANGGPPIWNCYIDHRDSAGNLIERRLVANLQQAHTFNVGEDGRYRFEVRSIGDTGLLSGAVSLGVQMGHTQQGYYDTRYATRYWETPHSGNIAKGKDDPIWWTVGTNISVNAAHFRNLYRGEGTSASVPGYGFTTNWIINNADPGPLNGNFDVPFGLSIDAAIGPQQGNNQYFGIVPRGNWSTVGDLRYMMVVDDFWFSGVETYSYSEWVYTRYYAQNSYW